MTDTLHYEIVSPECLLKDAHAAMIVVPGTDGDFTALPHHAPMMSTIRPGVVEIYETEGAAPTKLFLKGGLAQINPTGLTILAEETIELDAVNADELNQQISDTREDIEDAKDDIERTGLEKKLAWMVALAEVVHAA